LEGAVFLLQVLFDEMNNGVELPLEEFGEQYIFVDSLTSKGYRFGNAVENKSNRYIKAIEILDKMAHTLWHHPQCPWSGDQSTLVARGIECTCGIHEAIEFLNEERHTEV
jgi:hypothetical protein